MKRTPMPARSKPMSRGRGISPSRKPIAPKNRKRSAAALDQDFGEEAKTVRALPCLVAGCCMGPSEPAHVKSRGAGGGRFDIVPLCHAHHREQHSRGIRTFSKIYGLDLRLEADRVALEHSEPLGICGLARRWAAWLDWSIRADRVDEYEGDWDPHSGHDLGTLLGWVRRALERSPAGKAAAQVGQREHEIRGAMLLDLCVLPLSINDLGALADAAGWPS
jgi:hypothetical protein